MVRVNKLRNLLRKWRRGLVTENEVHRGFEDVLEVSIEFTNEFGKFRNQLRVYDWDNMKAYQAKNISAAKLIEKGGFSNYKKAIRHIDEGKKIRKKLSLVLNTISILEEGENLLNVLEESINSRWIKSLPSILILNKYLKEADLLMRQQKFIEAKVLIESCIKDIEFSMESIFESEESLIKNLNELIKTCSSTRHWVQYCYQPQFEIQGKVEFVIMELIEEKKMKFVGRLIEDFAFVLKERITFNKLLLKSNQLTSEEIKGLKQNLRKGGWLGGGNFLLKRELKAQQLFLKTN
ncbi:MAG: hypothetical protein DWQ02_14420 [Bacteroidetes bacterium]|nr:MAG: hypothetical protein DWQ02_14420 [Bacteroidota bacterium]